MSPSHVVEPTYETIKQRLMVGHWPMGARLEAGRLADELGVSITPVRDSLSRLVGEQLVDLIPGIGFHVMRLTERTLRDLLDLNHLLLLAALRVGYRSGLAAVDIPAKGHADRTGNLFAQIASQSCNEALVDTVRKVSTRLHVTRDRELAVLPDAVEEVNHVHAALITPNVDLAGVLTRYHTLRKREAGQLHVLLHM